MTDGPDTFTQDRLLWQEQVLADRSMTLICLHVALVIGSHVNRKTGEAWPSQETIASTLAITPDGVRKIVRQLVDHGHLTVAVRHGRGDSNRYRIALKTQPASGVSEGKNPASQMGIETRNPASQMGMQAGNPASEAKETQPAGWPNSLMKLSEEKTLFPASETQPKRRRPSASKTATSDAQFDEFWLQVPKAKDKADARRAYDKAILSGAVTHHEIMLGIARYAAERQGEDSRFTKYPATWLNKACWADVPARPTTGQHQPVRQNGQRFDAMAYAAERMAHMEDEDV